MSAMPFSGGIGYSSSRKSKSTPSQKSRAISRACRIEWLEDRLYLASAAYTFQNANLGAGGFVDGIFYDPHNQNVIYARTDIGGLYKSVNDGTSWSELLDFIGNNTTGSGNGTQAQEIGVLSFAIDPENSNNLYAMVGQYTGTNGDVLYSTNAGATWNTTALGFYVGGNSNGRATGEHIAVDPYDSNIVLVGSNANGLWESTNAGHSFTQFSNLSTTASINFVYFDPYGGTAGSPTQEIFVGEDSTSTGTNLYESTNGGTTFVQISANASGPTGWMPNRAVLANDGNLYVTYSNALAPNGSLTNGGVFRLATGTDTWANISPDEPQITNGSSDQFGYVGIALDPNNPDTIVVTSFDRYAYGDAIWRTTDANGPFAPQWTALFDFINYNGFNPTRNTTAAPWDAAFDDGIGNWAGDVAIDPFNSAQIMYGTGQGIWATNNGTSSSALTAPNSWYFPDTGIEFTAVGDVAATTGGTPLYSAMGDIGGFANTSLNFSPTQGSIGGGSTVCTDYAGLNPSDAVIVGSFNTNAGVYTTNGSTFTAFGALPIAGATNGTIAESANGSTIVWAPTGQTAYYSTNHGTTWTKATLGASGTLPTGGTIVSDKVNPNYFYYWTENSNDNSWTLYISTDAGQQFTASAGGAVGTGNVTLAVNQFVAGQLWISSYIGVYESTNFGASFTHLGSFNTGINSNNFAVGAPAPGSSIPALYMYGTLASGGFEGLYRSDDGGNTWVQLNTTSQQWGGLVQSIAADPNVFGRVYLGINGRGIIMGDPTSSVPAGWSDIDINEPGNPGFSTSTTTLSSGTVSNLWSLAGGGAGFSSTPISISSLSRTGGVATAVTSTASGLQIGQMITIAGATNSAYDGTFVITGLGNTTAGLSSDIGAATEFTFAIAAGTDTASGTITATPDDQFNFAYEPLAGNQTISAQIKSITNADIGNGTPQAGLMYRASTNANDPFFAIAQTMAGSLVLEYRTTTGGGITSQTLTGVPVGAEYVEIVRNGSNFSAFYGTNGTAWTQLGSTIAISVMPATANAGLFGTASYNPQLTAATFASVTVATGPTVVNAAAANPSPVTGTSTALSALGSENGSGTGLTYTWTYTGPNTVTFTGATNGTNAAQNITANFQQAGSYNFTVTIADSSNNSVTSSVGVTVVQTPTSVNILPANLALPIGSTESYSTLVGDQFGAFYGGATIVWGITGSANSINSSGQATLGSTPGTFTITATVAGSSTHGTTSVIAENFAVASGSTLDINLSSAGAVNLTSSQGTIMASQNGVQVPFTGITAIAVTETGTGDIVNINGAISEPFTFTGTGTSTLNVNAGTLTMSAVPGGIIPLGVLSIASGAAAAIAPATTSSATTLSVSNLSLGTNATFDVANNIVLIDYGSGTDPISTIASEIAGGYNGGSWNGAGIISSVAQTHSNYALGYADSADPGNPAGLASGTIEIKYTLLGDANLDGIVNGTDFGIMAANFNKGVNGWDQGDFDYNNIVNGADFGDLAANFNQGASIAVAAPPAVTVATTTESTSGATTSTAASGTLTTTGATTVANEKRSSTPANSKNQRQKHGDR